MVTQPNPYILIEEDQKPQDSDLKWTSVVVREVVEKEYRLEASVYGIESRKARENLEQCKWDIVYLGDQFEKAFYLEAV